MAITRPVDRHALCFCALIFFTLQNFKDAWNLHDNGRVGPRCRPRTRGTRHLHSKCFFPSLYVKSMPLTRPIKEITAFLR